jgi:hypothetical protein
MRQRARRGQAFYGDLLDKGWSWIRMARDLRAKNGSAAPRSAFLATEGGSGTRSRITIEVDNLEEDVLRARAAGMRKLWPVDEPWGADASPSAIPSPPDQKPHPYEISRLVTLDVEAAPPTGGEADPCKVSLPSTSRVPGEKTPQARRTTGCRARRGAGARPSFHDPNSRTGPQQGSSSKDGIG